MQDILAPTADPAWTLSIDGYDPLRESGLESRFAISNGFMGLRGTRSTTRGERWVVPARTYIAGLFDAFEDTTTPPGLVAAADWLRVRILLPDGLLVRHPGEVLSHRMTLDLRRGALLTEWRHAQADRALRVHTLRLVSQHDRAVGLQLINIEVEHGNFELTLKALFEGIHLGLVPQHLGQDLGIWHTRYSGKALAIAAAPSLQLDGQTITPTPDGELAWSWRWTARPGQTITFQRLVTIVRGDSLDPGPADQARATLAMAQRTGWRGVLSAHETAWATRWQSSDVQVQGDDPAQKALRFAVYNLVSAANPDDARVSVGARALTGDDYHGHVFWDTEIFLLPFYTLTWPEAARTLLMYRFRTLDAARHKARSMGWRGAMYAWESADTGAETTPEQVIGPDNQVVEVLCGKQEQHISADIAYAIWQYWQTTGDDDFLQQAGAEILLETGRFWASRTALEADGLWHIRGVIGPDEYHEHIDDNAYTNIMARWTIRRALDVAAELRTRWPARWASLSAALGLDDAELRDWQAVAEAMATGFDPNTGLYEQFSGYFKLEDVDLAQYAGRSMPMDIVLGRERTRQTQVVKQADVVALLALLPDEFPPGTAAPNFRYYETRCGHGSSLSPAMHGVVAARLGDAEMALRFFRQAAAIDLGDTHAGHDGGVHIAAQGGIWMAAVFGFAGLSLRDDGIALDPHMPAGWDRLAFAVQWRQRRLRIIIDRQHIEATLEAGDAMAVHIAGLTHAVSPSQSMARCPLSV
jgi:trehalose/maltose hydrolase-like predicted phosphorylase